MAPTRSRHSDSQVNEIDATLVNRLIRTQFPQWAQLPVTLVENGGWDNKTFRLGDSMLVRLPSSSCYVAQVEKEHRWLPKLRPHLPLPIPIPLRLGAPGEDYPWPWSIYCWLDGDRLSVDRLHDIAQFAIDARGCACRPPRGGSRRAHHARRKR